MYELNNLDSQKRNIQVENVITYIFIFIIVSNLKINNMQLANLELNSEELTKKIHNGNLTIFIIALIIYIYFFKNTYMNYIEIKRVGKCNEIENTYLGLLANLFFVVAGIILVYLENKNV